MRLAVVLLVAACGASSENPISNTKPNPSDTGRVTVHGTVIDYADRPRQVPIRVYPPAPAPEQELETDANGGFEIRVPPKTRINVSKGDLFGGAEVGDQPEQWIVIKLKQGLE